MSAEADEEEIHVEGNEVSGLPSCLLLEDEDGGLGYRDNFRRVEVPHV